MWVDDILTTNIDECGLTQLAREIVGQKKWSFLGNLILVSVDEREQQRWDRFFRPLIVGTVDILFAGHTDGSNTAAVDFLSNLNAKTLTILMGQLSLAQRTRVCAAAKSNPSKLGLVVEICHGEQERAADRLYENRSSENYDIFVALFKWLYTLSGIADAFATDDADSANGDWIRASDVLRDEFVDGTRKSTTRTTPAEVDTKTYDEHTEAALYLLHRKLWVTDETKHRVRECIDRIAVYVGQWVRAWGELNYPTPDSIETQHSDLGGQFDAIVADDVSPGCLLYLLCAVRMARTLVNVYRLTHRTVTVSTFLSRAIRWTGLGSWWGATAADGPVSDLHAFHIADDWFTERLELASGPEAANVASVSVDNRTVVLESIILRLYCAARLETTASEPFASDVRAIVANADEGSVRRRLFRWYRRNIDRNETILPPCRRDDDFDFLGECGGGGKRAPPNKKPVGGSVSRIRTDHSMQLERETDKIGTFMNPVWECELTNEFVARKWIVSDQRPEWTTGSEPLTPYPDPDRYHKELLLDTLLAVVESMRVVIPTAAGGATSALSVVLAELGWGSGRAAAPAKTLTAVDAATRRLTDLLSGPFYSGEEDNRSFVERCVPWMTSACMLSFVQLLTLHAPNFWTYDTSDDAVVLQLPLVAARDRRSLLEWIGARRTVPTTLTFLRDVVEIGRFLLYRYPVTADAGGAVPTSIQTSLLKRRFTGLMDKNRHWEWMMLGFLRDQIDDVVAYHRLPVRFRGAVSQAPEDGDIEALIRVNVDAVQPPEYDTGKRIYRLVPPSLTNTNTVRAVRDWLAAERYADDAYVGEMMARKRPRLVSIDSREYLDA